jgi:xanthosine utilization system XapX-like protein
MKILYKPFALITGVIASMIGERVFKAVWAKIDEHEPPEATQRDAKVGKAMGAAALQAATLAATKAAANRASARSFHYLFGIWPGPESAEEAKK